jgi:hypothetical protein
MSMFQKRHYVALARFFGQSEQDNLQIDNLCILLKHDNANFNEKVFREAINDNKPK